MDALNAADGQDELNTPAPKDWHVQNVTIWQGPRVGTQYVEMSVHGERARAARVEDKKGVEQSNYLLTADEAEALAGRLLKSARDLRG
jgi:hypothetical protein